MKVNRFYANSFIVLETDLGDFRVWRNGAIDQWNDGDDVWGYFDEYSFEDSMRHDLLKAASELNPQWEQA